MPGRRYIKSPPDRPVTRTGYRPGSGPKPTPIDPKQVESMYGIGCTHAEVAAVLGLHVDSYRSRLYNEPKLMDAVERGRAKGGVTLRRMQWQEAKNGNPTMLIWLGKQLLGQRDKFDVGMTLEHKVERPDLSGCSPDELATLREAAAIMKRVKTPPPVIDGNASEVRQIPPPAGDNSDEDEDAA